MATLRSSSVPNYPPGLIYLQSCSFFVFFLLLLTSATSFAAQWTPHSVATPRISYSEYCNHFVPESTVDPSSSAFFPDFYLRFNVGFFSGGDSFFYQNSSVDALPRSATFSPMSLRRTLGDEKVYKIEARLDLRIPRAFASMSNPYGDRTQWLTRIGEPSTQVSYRSEPRFEFSGFWSESTRHACMVGSGNFVSAKGDQQSFDVVLKLNYSKSSNIYGSLVNGVLESVRGKNKQSYFEPISILGVTTTPQNYEFKLLEQGNSECGTNKQESSILERVGGDLCSVFFTGRPHMFGLSFGTGCDTSNRSCSPFGNDIGYLPEFMSLLPKWCHGDKMQMLLSFSKTSSLGSSFPFDPKTALVAEGAWDAEKKSFCGIACRILNFSDSLAHAVVGDCSSMLSLTFPGVLSIRNMSPVVGHLRSLKAETDPGYFSEIQFNSRREMIQRFPNLRYEYTESERVLKLCGGRKNSRKKHGKHYPNAQTSDMKFRFSMNKRGDSRMWAGSATPLFVGDHMYRNLLKLGKEIGGATQMNNALNSFSNISYRIQFPTDFSSMGINNNNTVTRDRDIYAEGTYDRDTGDLCMIGCQALGLKNREFVANSSLDCSIVIKIKFSSMESHSDYRLKGSMESTREKNDVLYFERMEILSRSIYGLQAEESVWRMDLEITMVMISNTLSCVFVGMQLYHMKKHPESVPFISIAMLTMLTLGHMIPLLLNFEAMFKGNRNKQNMFFQNDGWLETNEIVVRMVTMVAFLLESRALQLAWIGKKNEEHHKTKWDAEKKVFYVCIPLYLIGGFIAWLVNRSRTPQITISFGGPHARNLLYRPYNLKRSLQRPSLWKDLKAYGGLILDGFLLPQILFNVICNSNETALAASFYIGTSIVRWVPHVYDLYRSHSYGKSLDWSFIYANHKMDYYSTAWNIVIPCVGFVFALMIFLQQRFGGRYVVPKRFSQTDGYEKVPETAGLELSQTTAAGGGGQRSNGL